MADSPNPIVVAARRLNTSRETNRVSKTATEGRKKIFAPLHDYLDENGEVRSHRDELREVERQVVPQGAADPVVMTAPQNNNVCPAGDRKNGQVVYLSDFREIRNNARGGQMDVAFALIQIIADHINRLCGRGGTESFIDSPNKGRGQRNGTERKRNRPVIEVKATNFGGRKTPRGTVVANAKPNFVAPSPDEARLIYEIHSQELTVDGTSHTTENSEFLQVEHIFVLITYLFEAGTERKTNILQHAALLVISPRQKSIGVLDSLHHRNAKFKRHEIMINAINLVAHHLGDDFVFSEWKCREGRSIQQNYQRLDCVYIADIDNWRVNLANILLHELNEDDQDDPFNFPLSGKEENLDISNGWKEIPRDYLLEIPANGAARTGMYTDMTKAACWRHCREQNARDLAANRQRRYMGYTTRAKDSVEDMRRWMEDEDWYYKNPNAPQ